MFPRVLQEYIEVLRGPLAHKFNKSINSVTNLWKFSLFDADIQNGNRSSTSTYGPVSLTSVARKLLDSIIVGSIRVHLERHGLIKDS